MRYALALLMIFSLSACSHRDERQREAERERKQTDQNSAAFKAGEAAHEMAKHAEKTAAEAAHALQDGARKAREGWKQKEQEDRDKPHQP